MTTPNPISEILEALDGNPQLQEELRQRILTREVLALPEQLAELTATVANMARVFEQRLAALEAKQDATDARFDGIDARFDGVDDRFDGIDTRFDGVDARFDGVDDRFDGTPVSMVVTPVSTPVSMVLTIAWTVSTPVSMVLTIAWAIDTRLDGIDTRLDSMQGQLNNITGTDYERQAVRRAPRLVRRYLGIQNVEVLIAINRQNGRAITDLVNNAAMAGAITEDDADDLDRADIILQGNSPDGDGVYVVAEVSITVDDADVDRASQRARILHDASGVTTHAAVIGASISDANRERALSSHVTFIALID